MSTPLSLPGQDDENTQGGQGSQGQGSSVNLNTPQNPMAGRSAAPESSTSPSTSSGIGTTAAKAGGAGTSGAPNVQNNFKPTNSGSFSNLQNYLNANQGWDQSTGGLAGQITSNIQNQANTTQNNLNNAQNAFTTQNQQAQNPYSGYTADNAGTTASTIANNTINSGSLAPTDQSTISTLQNASYNGPTGLESLSGANNLSGLQSQANNLSNEAQETQTEGGRTNLLNQMFGGNNYNAGEQSLDQALLQSNPNQLAQLSGIGRMANNVTSGINTNEAQDQQAAQQATLGDQGIAAATNLALNNAAGTYLQNLPGFGGNVAAYQPGVGGTVADPYNILNSQTYSNINNLNTLLGGSGSGGVGSFANSLVGSTMSPYLSAANQAQAGQYQRVVTPRVTAPMAMPKAPTNGASSQLTPTIGSTTPYNANSNAAVGPPGTFTGGSYNNSYATYPGTNLPSVASIYGPGYNGGGMVFPSLKKYMDKS